MLQEGSQEGCAHQLLPGAFKNCLLHLLLGRVGRRAWGRVGGGKESCFDFILQFCLGYFCSCSDSF